MAVASTGSEIGILSEEQETLSNEGLQHAIPASTDPGFGEECLNNDSELLVVVNVGALSGTFDSDSSSKHEMPINDDDKHQSLDEQVETPLQEDAEDETTELLKWFQTTFSQIEKDGCITLKDFKYTARNCDVRINLKLVCSTCHAMLHVAWFYIQ